MDPLPTPPPWNPEDDFLLKTAIEDGASLEALARGVVKLSRRYSLVELTERWRSMLYDSDVSAEAAAAMVDFEIAKYNGDKIKEASTKDVSTQMRKAQEIWKAYDAKRKKIPSEDMMNKKI